MNPSVSVPSAVFGSDRLVLGTAQLGIDYGISNRAGKPTLDAVRDIIATAWSHGIREFDTAQAYGDSERRLGCALEELGVRDEAKIVTKLDPQIDYANADRIIDAIQTSLERLGVSKLHGILVHHERLLDQWRAEITEAFRNLIEGGVVAHVGISVYSPAIAFAAFEAGGITMIQVPANLLDHRFLKSGIFETARLAGITIYIRSVFLQGLINMLPSDLPPEMMFAAATVREIRELCQYHGLTPIELALGYVRRLPGSPRILFGSETAEQVSENVGASSTGISQDLFGEINERFGDVPESIWNPVRWPQHLVVRSQTAREPTMMDNA